MVYSFLLRQLIFIGDIIVGDIFIGGVFPSGFVLGGEILFNDLTSRWQLSTVITRSRCACQTYSGLGSVDLIFRKEVN